MKTKIKLVNIRKTFANKIVALKNISFEVGDQEYITILGPSGCGKTTLLRIIAGLETPDRGEVFIDGQLVNQLPPERRHIGFVFQHFALFPHLNVWQNITYGPRIRGLPSQEIEKVAERLLKLIRLFSRKEAFPNQLSIGMQQRVGFARALASGSKLILLDEPLSSLDAKIRDEIMAELKSLAKNLKLTALHVTHDQEEAMFISDRIVLVKKGEIEQIDTPRELYRSPKSIFAASFIGESNFLEGVVIKKLKQEIIVSLLGGQQIKAKSGRFEKGNKVVVAFRPEQIILSEDKEENLGLKGNVRTVTFLAGKVLIEIELKGKLVVRARVAPSSHSASLVKGDEVTLKIEPRRVLVYPYPEKGIDNEIRTG